MALQTGNIQVMYLDLMLVEAFPKRQPPLVVNKIPRLNNFDDFFRWP
ncbi:hypothetical protein [Halobacillus sp. H74]